VQNLKQVSLDATSAFIWFHVDTCPIRHKLFPLIRFDFYCTTQLTSDLENLFSNAYSRGDEICPIYGKFHWNPSTKYRDNTRHAKEMLADGRTDERTDGGKDRRPEHMMLSAHLVGDA